MKDAKTISDFVKKVSNMYSVDLTYYIHDYNENDQVIPAPIFKDGVVTSERIEFLSKLLGMNPSDIEEANMQAAECVFKKYPFFVLLNRFEAQKSLFSSFDFGQGTSMLEANLIRAIIGEKNLIKKYDDNDILERLNTQLKEFDKMIPGTFHPEGKITQFHHEEAEFIDFPQYPTMMKSFFEVYDKMSELFFKAWKTDLSSDEINEYNLFVSYFQAKECASSKILHYDTLCEHRDLYISEGYTQLESYMKINRITTGFEPWKCKQFAEHREYAQRYQDIYPATIQSINDFCMHIKNILCVFIWSDAPFVEDEDDIFAPEEFKIGKYQECTRVYIPKNANELGNDVQNALQLRQLACPASKGGLNKKRPEVELLGLDLLKRIKLYLEWGK